MRVILTHEQADFDAVASQLGARLLDREAVPVLPNRINRNVRSYLTFYGSSLPFVERGDLPAEKLESAVLVDTQSLALLKGMDAEALVHVLDHHQLDENLPDHWQLRVEPVGATTTLVVELLQERRIALNTVEATLLMLGIYEDTGSLTYARTTPRDLHAAAYLLDQGAALQIVGEYLNQPLSLAQQAIDDVGPNRLEIVRPALTIGQIMSHGGPLVVDADRNLEEALEYMQRYGYEGYPVVEDGRVIGLLTRRAVDRALSHRMKVTARAVMEAGEVTVHPDDSIEQLQRRMTDSGWGQVPVVDPETGEIIGIVTRTDLLKTLSPEPAIPGHLNFAGLLDAALPEPRRAMLKTIAAAAHDQRNALYIVGGFVRDLILEQPGFDLDLVVEGDAIALAHFLAKRHGGRVTAHRRFGTAKWHPEREDFGVDGVAPEFRVDSVDLVTARTEFYTHPTALPTVERGSIKLDLHRRDFTINTLALRLDGPNYGDLHDYWGGLNDLRQGLIRVLHSLSFVDDPTRMLRAVRFEGRFNFTIETRTLELLGAALELLERVSGDRIRHELDYILDEQEGPRMFDRLRSLGLMEAIHPDLTWSGASRPAMFSVEPAGDDWGLGPEIAGVPFRRALAYILWLLPLPAERSRRIARRLQLRGSLAAVIADARRLWEDLPELAGQPPSTITFRLDEADPAAVYAVWRATEDEDLAEPLARYARSWRHIKPGTDGHALDRRGLPPGPAYKHILTTLRRAWLDGEISSEEEEGEALERLLRTELQG